MKISRFLAAFLMSFAVTFSTVAKADNWGCEVLLCLANPAGPMAVSQCVPPIQKLYAAIFKAKPEPFPSCEMAGNGNYAGLTSILVGYEWAERKEGDDYIKPIFATAIQVNVTGMEPKWYGISGGQIQPYLGSPEDYLPTKQPACSSCSSGSDGGGR